MDFTEKANIRLEHWIRHNEGHLQEYEAFARDLETNEKSEAARYIREMAALITESNCKLRKALDLLKQRLTQK